MVAGATAAGAFGCGTGTITGAGFATAATTATGAVGAPFHSIDARTS